MFFYDKYYYILKKNCFCYIAKDERPLLMASNKCWSSLDIMIFPESDIDQGGERNMWVCNHSLLIRRCSNQKIHSCIRTSINVIKRCIRVFNKL